MTRSSSRRSRVELLNASVLHIDPGSPPGLQGRIGHKIVTGIPLGSPAAGQRMPSTRALAGHLAVSRNTVAAAYQGLIADGHPKHGHAAACLSATRGA